MAAAVRKTLRSARRASRSRKTTRSALHQGSPVGTLSVTLPSACFLHCMACATIWLHVHRASW